MAAFPADVRDAHRHSSQHREELLRSMTSGCFHCCSVFSPQSISEWVDEDASGTGQTAMCPECGIDAVLGDASGFSIEHPFLVKMKGYWF